MATLTTTLPRTAIIYLVSMWKEERVRLKKKADSEEDKDLKIGLGLKIGVLTSVINDTEDLLHQFEKGEKEEKEKWGKSK
jgi:hypothetical protein